MMINRLTIILGLFPLTNTTIVNAETISNLEAVTAAIKHQGGKQFLMRIDEWNAHKQEIWFVTSRS